MSRAVGPGWFGRSPSPWDRTPGPGIRVADLVRQSGARGVAALVAAALVAFAPLAVLIWFTVLRLDAVEVAPGVRHVQVKPEQLQQAADDEKPGETALLQVICQVPTARGDWRDLYAFDDPLRRPSEEISPPYVRSERVYLRPAGKLQPAFALLGRPPLSAWLPAGDYEILVVHEPRREWEGARQSVAPYPFVSERVACALPAAQRTVVRVPLGHHDDTWGHPLSLQGDEQASVQRPPTLDEIRPLLEAVERARAIPTPGGVLWTLPEPAVRHTKDHRGCTVDWGNPDAVSREWTRDQLATLFYWLSPEAAGARERLATLQTSLDWRSFFEGWYCYAAAGVAGLVFARWGTILLLSPRNSRQELVESLKLLGILFLVAALGWFVFSVLTDPVGCRGGAIPMVPRF
jgi:hypothetical protein